MVLGAGAAPSTANQGVRIYPSSGHFGDIMELTRLTLSGHRTRLAEERCARSGSISTRKCVGTGKWDNPQPSTPGNRPQNSRHE